MKKKMKNNWLTWTIAPFAISIIILMIFQQFIEMQDARLQQAIGTITYAVGIIITDRIT